MGHLAKDRRKNSIASLYDSSAIEKVTYLCISSWILVANGSGGFESCSTDQNVPEASETAKHHELDDFIDQLEEVGFSALNDETRIQPEFGAIRAKTLSELEEDLEKLLEDTRQETPTDEKALSSSRIHFVEPSLQRKKRKTSFKKTTRRKKSSKYIFQTSIISTKRSNIAFS